ncbi:extracellular peptidase. Metallo peptidase. MEROPS family M35 [Massilia sp. PDC64]|nr:M35 family metallo-endopeptidase [Massilia sp. PDC64]SDC86016.1 extracellular peptidase. Metallo peptidase. MEROPS family M35 [Massilia sp. PDC64]
MRKDLLKLAAGAAALAVSLSALSAHAAPGNGNGVVVSVAPEKTSLGKSDDVVVKVTFTNTSGSPQYVLKSRTPFEEIEAPLFEITRDGQPVRYLGAIAKRGAPTAADYFLLKPGASYTAKVELSALYDMATTGDYAIRYRIGNGSGKAGDELKSEAATVWIDGVRPRGSNEETRSLAEMQAQAGMVTAAGGALSFNKCTASQQADITTAVSSALAMATDGDAYMAKGTMGTRYTKWFGAVDSARVATVKSHFAAIKDAFATKPITVDCGCKKTYYAYVYPTQPYTIHVCKAFWSAPMTGTDSKGGTLVHEMSHFNVVAGTDDWVYGQSGAASLAVSNPSQAIDNADSHEYFGENTPALQ